MTVHLPHSERSSRRRIARGCLAFAALGYATASPLAAEPRHGVAMHGTPAHVADMAAFPYADAVAPKGGRLSLGVLGTFDSLNPLILRGESASGIRDYVYESLLVRAGDEPFSLYGHIAESIDLAADRRSITFKLRAIARFSDGAPITADDVLFSHALLRDKGWKFMRDYYGKVASAEKLAADSVRFTFKPEADGSADREIPLILGLMPIVPKHLTDADTFERTTLVPPIGSGPYVVAAVDAGRSLLLRRNPDWWAKDLPAARGRFNFDEIRSEYFRAQATLFEAFKSGAIDVISESDPARWLTGYDFPAMRDGRVQRREIASRLPAGMSALVFNTRREQFRDPRVRAALIALFDAEWINRNIYAGLARRTHSFFERSALSSFGRPADGRERALLAPFPGVVRPDILDGMARLPISPGTGQNRTQQAAALEALRAAGYRLVGNRLLAAKTGAPLAFEVMLADRGQERLVLAYARSLAQVGITVTARIVDSAQYEARLKDGQYDMIQTTWAASLSPGNEQWNRFGSGSVDVVGTRNYAGVSSPAVDAMIQAIVAARTAAEFASAVRAYDRVLRSGDYVIPLFHLPNTWIAHWSRIRPPANAATTNSGFDLDTWFAARP